MNSAQLDFFGGLGFCPFRSVVRVFKRFLASGKFNDSITLEQWHAWHAALNHGRASL